MLNKAHSLHRQAEKASRKGKVEEAIQLHKEAADILRDLLQTIINDKVCIFGEGTTRARTFRPWDEVRRKKI